MKTVRRLLIAFLAVAVILSAAPFAVPIPPLSGTVSPEALADQDSRFIDVNGLLVHYKIQGSGAPALVLLHGFAASTFSFEAVMASLAELRTTVAFDRPAFGLTERPMSGEWDQANPYTLEAQADQTVALMDRIGLDEAVLVGHSAGGAVAVLAALRHPERVRALILVDAAIYQGGTPGWLGPLLRTPQMRRLGPLIARRLGKTGGRLLGSAWCDASRLTPETVAGYEKPLRAQNWDRALWELVMASHPPELADRLGEVLIPVLVITGDCDRIVPPEQSVRLAERLANAELVTIAGCGHLPQEECPEAFLEAVTVFLTRLDS